MKYRQQYQDIDKTKYFKNFVLSKNNILHETKNNITLCGKIIKRTNAISGTQETIRQRYKNCQNCAKPNL